MGVCAYELQIIVIVPFWTIHPVGIFCLARAADSFVTTVPVREAFTLLDCIGFTLYHSAGTICPVRTIYSVKSFVLLGHLILQQPSFLLN